MEDSSCIDAPVNFNIRVGTSASALPMIKAEEPPEEDMDQSYNMVIGTTPMVKAEPMDVSEEETAQLQEDAEFPSETSASSPTANNYSDNHEAPSTEISETQQSISLLWPGDTIIKQEPDVEIDHDEGHIISPEDNMSSPDGCYTQFMQDPHPVMILKRETREGLSSEQMVDGRLENEEDKDTDAPPGLWLRMLNRKAQCLVCNGTCRVTRNRKIPTLPFCKKCKKAYFYQLSHLGKGIRKQRSNCLRGGNCIIDYRFPKEWCSVCHLRKFKAVLMNYAGLSRAMSFENHLAAMSESGEEAKSTHQKRYARKKPCTEKEKFVERLGPPESSVLIEKELVVRVEKLTKEDLAAYGITDPMAYGSTNERSPLDFNRSPINGEKSDSNEYRLPPLQTKSNFLSSHVVGGSKLFPLSRNAEGSPPAVKKRKINNKPKFFPRISLNPKSREKKKSGGKPLSRTPNVNESVASIKVFVFTCGHACGLCNSEDAQRWLQRSGITTTMPYCNNTASPAPSQSTQRDYGPTMMMQSKPELSTLRGSVPHLKQLLDRPPEMQFRQRTPPVWSARPPEMQLQHPTPTAVRSRSRESQLMRPPPPVQRTPLINPTSVIGHPHPAFPRAVRLRPDLPAIDKPTIPGRYHLLPVRFGPPLHPPQGPLLLRVPAVSTSGNLPQPLPPSLPPAPGSVQLNSVPPIPPINAPLTALQHDVRLALAKTLIRPPSNLMGNIQAPSVSLVPPPISLIPVPGNIQLQSPVLVSSSPDFSQATSKTISSSQASTSSSKPLLSPSSKISKPKPSPNSLCVSPNSGQKKVKLQWYSASSTVSLKPSAKTFSTLASAKNTSGSSLSSAGSSNPSQRKQAKADTKQRQWLTQPLAGPKHTSDSSQSSADKRNMSESSSDPEHTSDSLQTSSHLEDTEQMSVEMNCTTASQQSPDGEHVTGLNETQHIGTSQPTDDIKCASGSLQAEPSGDMEHISGSPQPLDDMECTAGESSQQQSSDKEDTTGPHNLSPYMECSAQMSDDIERLAGPSQQACNVESPAGSSKMLNDKEHTASSQLLSSNNNNTAVASQMPSNKGLTASSVQLLSDKEHTADSLQPSSSDDNAALSSQIASDNDKSAVSPQIPSNNDISAVSPQIPSNNDNSAVSPQIPSDNDNSAVSPQIPSDRGLTADTVQPSSDKENAADSMQPSSDKENAVDSMQPSSDNDTTEVSPQMPSDEGLTTASLPPSSDKDNTASAPQTSSDKELTVGSPQPSSVREHTTGSPQLSSDNEHTKSQSSSDKEHTEGS